MTGNFYCGLILAGEKGTTMKDQADNEYRYPDGKTPSEEARDSARMLATVLLVAPIGWAAIGYLVYLCAR